MRKPVSSTDVVIADAAAAWAKAVARSVGRAGHRAQVVTSTADALAALAVARRPAILIIELKVHEIDGLRMLAARRDDPAMRHVRVIVATASTSPQLLAQATALRPDRLLIKSQFTLAELVAVVDELVREG